MTLEEQLRETAEPWLAQEPLIPGQAAQLEHMVRSAAQRAARRRWLSGVGGVAVLALCVGYWPVAISLASEAPLVGPFIARWATYDRGAQWADAHGYLQPVGKSVTDHDYTLTVESYLADSSRTVIFISVSGPGLKMPMSFPQIDLRCGFTSCASGWGGRHEVVDGRLVGEIGVTGALPHPVSLVSLSAQEIAGVKGNWHISFLASRRALDPLARSIPINQHWQGEGYDLTVRRLLQAPTATVVELDGIAAGGFLIRHAELVIGGQKVPRQSEVYNYTDDPQGPAAPEHYRFQFDRSEGHADATFRLTDVIRWRPGGPVLDLTHPGARTEYGGQTYELQAVIPGGRTQVTVLIPAGYPWPAVQNVGRWVLVDAAGKEYPGNPGVYPQGNGPALLKITFESAVASPVRLEGRIHAESVPGPFETTVHLP